MNDVVKYALMMLLGTAWLSPPETFSGNADEDAEPPLKEAKVIDLLEGNTLDAWEVPSERWSLKKGCLVGDTGGTALDTPEWIYTRKKFDDFEFSCEMKLTGDTRRNTGVYFRANTFIWKDRKGKKSHEAPSGYEFDAAYQKPGKKRNYRGSLGDWYARPSLRIFPDPEMINQAYREEDWNRLTIRARGKRIEYWLNGAKIIDYLDEDPDASRKGMIGFQIHDRTVMKVQYRNIRVRVL